MKVSRNQAEITRRFRGFIGGGVSRVKGVLRRGPKDCGTFPKP